MKCCSETSHINVWKSVFYLWLSAVLMFSRCRNTHLNLSTISFSILLFLFFVEEVHREFNYSFRIETQSGQSGWAESHRGKEHQESIKVSDRLEALLLFVVATLLEPSGKFQNTFFYVGYKVTLTISCFAFDIMSESCFASFSWSR